MNQLRDTIFSVSRDELSRDGDLHTDIQQCKIDLQAMIANVKGIVACQEKSYKHQHKGVKQALRFGTKSKKQSTMKKMLEVLRTAASFEVDNIYKVQSHLDQASHLYGIKTKPWTALNKCVEEKFEKYFGYLARCEGKFCI